MVNKRVQEAIVDMEAAARDLGLDFYPIIFEKVNREIMLEGCSYGLPKRARHWSHGKAYNHQKINGKFGMSKLYEIIFANDPSYAYLMDTNTDIIDIMVVAHCYGHGHFSKNNCMFAGAETKMVYKAAERATRVDKYIEEHGIDRVEHMMDIGFAMDNHIDWHKGVHRPKYPAKSSKYVPIRHGEFDDLSNIGDNSGRSLRKVTTGATIPPSPESDLLWFFINYAPLEDWERDILSIIREESYYFYSIATTKVINEGLASFVHAELMSNYDKITDGEFMEFSRIHSSVVSPGNPYQINPYYVGFKIFSDIRKRWDDLHADGTSDITGMQKVIQVATEENDASFLRNYLTKELAVEMGMFNYGHRIKRKPGENKDDLTEEHGIIELKNRDLDKIIEGMTAGMVNYGAPMITIDRVDGDTLVMSHHNKEALDDTYTDKMLEFIYELWGANIELSTVNYGGEPFTYVYDESGLDIL